jgi:hypothetical protein
MNIQMKSTIQKMGAKLLRTKHLAIALAAAGLMAAVPILVLALDLTIGPLTPKKVYLFNNNDEVISTTTITVATLTVKVGSDSGFLWSEEESKHRLVIDYSSVGAIRNEEPPKEALLFLGCFVDDNPCVGSQANPPEHDDGATVPLGYVNVLSCDFSSCAGWDNAVDHVWFTDELSPGDHTVVIKAAVGNPLIPPSVPPTFFDGRNGPGTLFDEARNLVVTVLGSSEETSLGF